MQQYYGNEVRIIPKNAKKSRKNRVVKRDRGIKFIAIVVFLCVTVLLLSAFLSPISPLNARIFNRTWYFVKVFSTQDYEKCLLESENVKQRGGGGFVINDGYGYGFRYRGKSKNGCK